MARQLPFDVFVLRKVNKWQQRAQERSIELVDAIGVSPTEEMSYLWSTSPTSHTPFHLGVAQNRATRHDSGEA